VSGVRLVSIDSILLVSVPLALLVSMPLAAGVGDSMAVLPEVGICVQIVSRVAAVAVVFGVGDGVAVLPEVGACVVSGVADVALVSELDVAAGFVAGTAAPEAETVGVSTSSVSKSAQRRKQTGEGYSLSGDQRGWEKSAQLKKASGRAACIGECRGESKSAH
jgi:hypothetical protein